MPNTKPALIDQETFNQIENAASKNALCDYALFMGATAHNADIGRQLGTKCAGLKLYLNETFGGQDVWQIAGDENIHLLAQHMEQFPRDRPIVCHAEGSTLTSLLLVADLCKRPGLGKIYSNCK